MWLFRRRAAARVDSVRLGDLSHMGNDYPVLTVGQSRLAESFISLGFAEGDATRFSWASVTPIIDPGTGAIADVSVRVEDQIVGYLRPPALGAVVALAKEHHARSLEVPVMIMWTPAGPEVRAHACLYKPVSSH